MSSFYVKAKTDAKVRGPVSATALRKLAASGKLKPKHLISRDAVTWVRAQDVKGLAFPGNSNQRSEASPISDQEFLSKARSLSSELANKCRGALNFISYPAEFPRDRINEAREKFTPNLGTTESPLAMLMIPGSKHLKILWTDKAMYIHGHAQALHWHEIETVLIERREMWLDSRESRATFDPDYLMESVWVRAIVIDGMPIPVGGTRKRQRALLEFMRQMVRIAHLRSTGTSMAQPRVAAYNRQLLESPEDRDHILGTMATAICAQKTIPETATIGVRSGLDRQTAARAAAELHRLYTVNDRGHWRNELLKALAAAGFWLVVDTCLKVLIVVSGFSWPTTVSLLVISTFFTLLCIHSGGRAKRAYRRLWRHMNSAELCSTAGDLILRCQCQSST